MVSHLTSAFKHCDQLFTPEFASTFTLAIKDLILKRIDTLSQRDLKDIDKDEISNIISDVRSFLAISMSQRETAELVEHTHLKVALRFLKSENLEKRLKGISEIRNMVERTIERLRFEFIDQPCKLSDIEFAILQLSRDIERKLENRIEERSLASLAMEHPEAIAQTCEGRFDCRFCHCSTLPLDPGASSAARRPLCQDTSFVGSMNTDAGDFIRPRGAIPRHPGS